MDAGRCHWHRCGWRRAPRRHRREGSADQPLHAQPEAAVLPDQHLELLPIAAQEDEAVARVGLVPQFMLDHAGQTVDATPHVLGIAGHEDPLHGREAQHCRLRHARAVDSNSPARSAGMPEVNTHRRPLRVVIVRRRRRRRPRRDGGWTISSMKPGIPAVCSTHPMWGVCWSSGSRTRVVEDIGERTSPRWSPGPLDPCARRA